MATLREYFAKDLGALLTSDFTWQTSDEIPQDISVKVGLETCSSTRFVAYYIPKHPAYVELCISLIENLNEAVKRSNGVRTIIGFVGDVNVGLVGSDYCVVSNRVYVYLEDEPNDADLARLDQLCKNKGLWLTIRSLGYLKKKMEIEKPLAFISHDSRDKGEIAGPIAVGLQKMMCPVWYD